MKSVIVVLCFSLAAPLLLSADWQTPVNMGPVINSSQEEFSSSIPMDGNHFYFARGPVENMDIYESQYSNGQWQPPVNLGSNVNSSYADQDPTVIGDTMIIFSSDRPSPYSGYPFHLWFSKRDTNRNWEPAQIVGDPIGSNYAEATPWMMWEGKDTLLLFFASLDRPGGQGGWDIWQARKITGVWQTPTNLSPPVNTSGLESSPNIWVSHSLCGLDSIRMYYVASFGGCYADRIHGVWRPPVRLPDIINSGGMDRPTVTFDNSTLYFTSDRPGGYGLRDIWYSVKTSGVEGQEARAVPGPGFRLTACPNPFRDRSIITFPLEREEKVNLEVYSLEGRRIRSLFSGWGSPGVKRLIWDGRDDAKRLVGPGVYFVRYKGLDETIMTRLVKLD